MARLQEKFNSELLGELQKKLGLLIEDLEDPLDHNVNLIVGNEAGKGTAANKPPANKPKRR